MRKNGLTVAAIGMALLAMPASASAVTTKYSPKLTDYTSTKSVGGLCLIQGLTCPTITNTKDNGFLRTAGGSLAGVISEARGVFTSPSFKYRGADGDKADTVEFTMERRAAVGSLVEAEADAEYSVELIGGGKTLQLIDRKTLEGAPGFTTVGADVPASKLEDGTDYQFRITTIYVTTVTVIGQSATADYRDIELAAKAKSGGGSNQGGKNGRDGRDGKDGRGAKNACKGKVPSKKDLRNFIKKGKNHKANVHGSRLRLKVSNKKRGVNCRVLVIGKAKGYTKTDRVRVKRGNTKTLSMEIKDSKATRLASARKVKMKYRLKVERRKVNVSDKVRVKR